MRECCFSCTERSRGKSFSGSPKLSSNDRSFSNSLQDTRYLNTTVGAANISINPLEFPTRCASTTAGQAISSNNGQSVVTTTATIVSTSLATTATNNSTACHSKHNSNFNTITNNSGSVCHSTSNETNNPANVAFPTLKLSSKSEHLTGVKVVTPLATRWIGGAITLRSGKRRGLIHLNISPISNTIW
uniref:Uncharacterized protein n=1 Tax=Glossina palpalis gambiensis TaxID=67801 RepID=A0A1B0BYR0_9MUSC